MGDGGRAVLLGAVCLAGALALYAGALDRPLFGDDQLAVGGNPTVTQPSVTALRRLWVTDYWRGIGPDGQVTEMSTDRNLYRPVTIASFWLTARVAGVEPAAFRMGNVVLHALAATLLGLLCGALGWRRGAVVAAAFVLVHPVATDVVNRVVGRADVLAVCGVTAWLLVHRGAQRTGWTGMRALAAFAVALVALGGKESGVVLVPLALLAGALARGGRNADGAAPVVGSTAAGGGRRPGAAGDAAVGASRPVVAGADQRTARTAGDRKRRTGRRAGRGRGWLDVAALVCAVALYLVGRGLAVELPSYPPAFVWDLGGNPVWGAPLADRAPVAAALAWHYVRLLVWPSPLIAFDVPPVVPTWGDPAAWLGAALLVVCIAALIATAWRRHPVGLGIAWWLLSFLVVSQLLVPIGAYREVRFAYALVAAAALVLGCLAERIAARSGVVRAVAAVVVLAGVALAASAVAQRNGDYRDLQTLLEADVRQRPASPAALIRLANIHERARRDDMAERTFARVLELAPTSAQAHYELADFSARRGHAARARALHERAVVLNPSHYLSLMALGTMALDARDLDRAQAFLDRAAAVAPDDPFVIYNLAVLDDARGNRPSALARLTALVARRPDFTLAVRALEQLRADEARRGR